MNTKNNVIIKNRQPITDFYSEDLGELMSGIYAARGIAVEQDLAKGLKELIPFEEMHSITEAGQFITQFILNQESIVIVGDFDADGATSTALLVSFLRECGHNNVNFIIPNRFDMGYGLSTKLIDKAIQDYQPKLIITVDNGVTAIEEVDYAKSKGISVVITDHHMPDEAGLPAADYIINPNLANNEFPSKNLAGVGVAFYTTIAIRHHLRAIDYFATNNLADINLAQYLDLVALGTVADMVELDKNNRILVHQGLMRIKNGYCRPGISSILAVSQKDATMITASDLGYAIGPRLNAAGRIADMTIGVKCLLASSFEQADLLAEKLHDLNLERREIELEMQQSAQKIIEEIVLQSATADLPIGVCLYDSSWHQGVSGIIASRLKDAFKRPVVIFSNATMQEPSGTTSETNENDELKGSVRSIKGVDIRQVLADINEVHPDMILKFGGHKGAAGLTIKTSSFEAFNKAFVAQLSKVLKLDDCYEEVLVDGRLAVANISIETAELIRQSGPWGMAFPEPIFEGDFNIMEQRIVGQRHLKLALQPKNGYEIINAIYFNADLDLWPDHGTSSINAAYRLDVTEYRGTPSLQLIILHLEKTTVEEEVGITEF